MLIEHMPTIYSCQKITEEEGLTEWVHPERKKEPAKKKRTTKPDGKKRKGNASRFLIPKSLNSA